MHSHGTMFISLAWIMYIIHCICHIKVTGILNRLFQSTETSSEISRHVSNIMQNIWVMWNFKHNSNQILYFNGKHKIYIYFICMMFSTALLIKYCTYHCFFLFQITSYLKNSRKKSSLILVRHRLTSYSTISDHRDIKPETKEQ